MSFTTGLSTTGGVHHCQPFYQRFLDCYESELKPHIMCGDHFEDYYECFYKEKQSRLGYQVVKEMHKWKVLAVPQYNELTDSFEPVRLPENPDDYFK